MLRQMSRLPLLRPDGLDPEQRSLYSNILGGPRGQGGAGRGLTTEDGELVGPFNAWLHSPLVGERLSQLGEAVRFANALPRNLIEIAVLVTAGHWRAQFEWWAHERIARREGVSEATIQAIRLGQRPEAASADELLVHDLASELISTRRVNQPLYDRARERFGDRALVDLAALLGYYALVSITLNLFAVPLPPGQAPPFDEPTD